MSYSPPVRKLALRCRPLQPNEHKLHARSAVAVKDGYMHVELPDLGRKHVLAYQYLYGPGETQDAVFNDLLAPIFSPSIEQLDDMVLFAYGPSQSGKSYTITGSPGQPGLVQQFGERFLALSHQHSAQNPSFKWGVELHFFEIFDEDAFDLLTYTGNPLRLRESKKEGWVYFEETVPIPVKKTHDLDRLIDQGFKRVRGTGAHSHLVYEFIVTCTVDGEEEWKRSVIFVDLADSERAQGSAKGQKGLHVLNDTLCTVAASEDGTQSTVRHRSFGWRDSKLTRYLNPFLDGHVCFIGCISPAASQFDETARTTQYMDKLKPFFRDYTVAHADSEHMSPVKRMASGHSAAHNNNRNTPQSTPVTTGRSGGVGTATSTGKTERHHQQHTHSSQLKSSAAATPPAHQHHQHHQQQTSGPSAKSGGSGHHHHHHDPHVARLESQIREQAALIHRLEQRIAALEHHANLGGRGSQPRSPGGGAASPLPPQASPTNRLQRHSGPTSYSLGPSQRLSTTKIEQRMQPSKEVGDRSPSPPRQAKEGTFRATPSVAAPVQSKPLGYSKSATVASLPAPSGFGGSLHRVPTQPIEMATNGRVVRQLSAPGPHPSFGASFQPAMNPFLPGPPPHGHHHHHHQGGFNPFLGGPQSPFGNRR